MDSASSKFSGKAKGRVISLLGVFLLMACGAWLADPLPQLKYLVFAGLIGALLIWQGARLRRGGTVKIGRVIWSVFISLMLGVIVVTTYNVVFDSGRDNDMPDDYRELPPYDD
jgi:hypothetical protein